MVADPSGAEDVEGADRHRAEPRLPVVALQQVLAHELGDRVRPARFLHRSDRRRHALLHPEGVDPEHLAGREVHDPREHREPFHRPEQRQRAEEVGLDRLARVRPHGVHPDDGGEMDHAVHPLHDPAQRVGVEDVPEHHTDVALAVMPAHRPARAAELAVEDHDLVVDTQPVRQGRADEPGPAGDENPLSARLSGFRHQVLTNK